jgi:hypothetical protein
MIVKVLLAVIAVAGVYRALVATLAARALLVEARGQRGELKLLRAMLTERDAPTLPEVP